MIQFFQKILKDSFGLKANLSPLRFSDAAISKIQSQLNSRPSGIRSTFKIQLQYEPDRFYVQVGFDEFKPGQSTLFHYPFPLFISNADEKLLRGSLLDYLEEEKSFFLYPEIEIEAEDTPKTDIIKFFINRLIISESSPEKEFAISHKDFDSSKHPFFLNALFSTGLVESIYLKSNWVQIELSREKIGRDSEQKIADVLLDYFEKCGYSMYINNEKIIPSYMS
jgi:hypothetical protein